MTKNATGGSLSFSATDPYTGSFESSNTSGAVSDFDISEYSDRVFVKAGLANFNISKTSFSIVGKNGVSNRISSISPSIEFAKGKYFTVQNPSSPATNSDHVVTVNGVTITYTTGSTTSTTIICANLAHSINNHASLIGVVHAEAVTGHLSVTGIEDAPTLSAGANMTLAADVVTAPFGYTEMTFGAPASTVVGDDYVEQQGWVNSTHHLWYTVRLRFFKNKPYCHLMVRVDGKYNDNSEGHDWDVYGPWLTRMARNFKIRITSDVSTSYESRQYNAFSGKSGSGSPYIDLINGSSSAYWRRDISQDTTDQILHSHSSAGDNKAVYYPKYSGHASVVMAISTDVDITGGKACRATVVHAGGTDVVNYSQNTTTINIGTYTFDDNSSITISDHGGSGASYFVAAGPMTISPTNSDPAFTIGINRVSDVLLSSSTTCIGAFDLWDNFPSRAIGNGDGTHDITTFYDTHRMLFAGQGLSIDLAISVNGNSSEMYSMSRAHPDVGSIPDVFTPFDATTVSDTTYDALMDGLVEKIHDQRDYYNSHGAMSYGDYYDTNSYYASTGLVPVIASQNLQNDHGFLLGAQYLRNPTQEMWDLFHAAMRYQANTGFASKGYPFSGANDGKRCGAIGRKGELPQNMIGWNEPLLEFGYGFRSFLLWYELTGEQYVMDYIRQSVDHAAYMYYQTRTYLPGTASDRNIGWFVRAMYYGHILFDYPGGVYATETDNGHKFNCGATVSPNVMKAGTQYITTFKLAMEGDGTNRGILQAIEDAGYYRLGNGSDSVTVKPANSFFGVQPVWAGLSIGALAMWHKYLTENSEPSLDGTTKDRIGNAVINCTDWVRQNAWRTVDGGTTYDMLYDIIPVASGANTPAWTDAGAGGYHYGWFWLDAAQYASEIAPAGATKTALQNWTDLVSSYFISRVQSNYALSHDEKYLAGPMGWCPYWLAQNGDGL